MNLKSKTCDRSPCAPRRCEDEGFQDQKNAVANRILLHVAVPKPWDDDLDDPETLRRRLGKDVEAGGCTAQYQPQDVNRALRAVLFG